MNRAAHLLRLLTEATQERLDDPKNAQKGDWIDYHPLFCVWLLTCEIRELLWECYLIGWFGFIGETLRSIRHKRRALEEAGDVCVCIIMLLNVLGVIKDETARNNSKR